MNEWCFLVYIILGLNLSDDIIMIMTLETWTLLLITVFTTAYAQTDKRCFLEGGWSTISFFVREDLTVGSVIGKIRAIGVVGQDIALSLAAGQSADLPVSIVTSGGEASLQLTGELDKEGVTGPSNLVVGVICERLGTNDTGFTIPINIRSVNIVKSFVSSVLFSISKRC